MRLSCDSLATQTLKYASVATLLRRLKWSSCVGFEESTGRLKQDSRRRDLEQCHYKYLPQREVVPWPAPSHRKILFSYCWKSWKNGDSYRACVLLIVYGHYLCISLYFWLIDRAAYWFALSIFYKLYHFQVDFTQTKFNLTLAKFNSTQTKYNFTQNDIQFHSSDIQFHTNEIHCHTNKIQFHVNEIQFHQNENSISNIHEIAKLPNSEQLFCYKLHPKILITFIILVYFNQQ